jgi:hypothetical protein
MKKLENDSHQEYVDKVLQNTQQFLEDTRRENQLLRARASHLEAERLRSAEAILQLQHTISTLQLQHSLQQQQAVDFEKESLRSLATYAEIEQQNSNLANLYVASYRLHGSLVRREVLDVIQEIIINLVGSEEIAIFELDPAAQQLRLISSFGVDERTCSLATLAESPIARTVVTGEMFVQEPPPNNTSAPVSSLTASIPLKINDTVIGVIAVFRMLPQKPVLAALDRELFGLLGTHAAMALYCSGLHTQMGAAR